jgi:hypothetical protein
MANIEVSSDIRNALIDNYNRYAQGIDSKDWPMVRACFADQVYIDYGSISEATGDPTVPRRADAWVELLQGNINGFDITRHAITNHRFAISDAGVSCTAYFCADHVIFANPEMPVIGDQEVATVVGEYTNTYQLDDDTWRISKSRLVVNFSSGNMSLFEIAQARAATKT